MLKLPKIVKDGDDAFLVTLKNKKTIRVLSHVNITHKGQIKTAKKWYEIANPDA